MQAKVWPTIIIGAGAAGLMTAIQLGRCKKDVLLLDSRKRIGAKILMSGGTRCNLTNRRVTHLDYATENPSILRSILKQFSSKEAIDFFADIGVDVDVEASGKYFPKSHSAQTVLDALMVELENVGIDLHTEKRVTQIEKKEQLFCVTGESFEYMAERIVLATGGLSFPSTGSDGGGLSISSALGHQMIETTPALVPLLTTDKIWKSLSGLTLPVCLTLKTKAKKAQSVQGSFLFTHFGFSGPSVLNISRYWLRLRDKQNSTLTVNFLPEMSYERHEEVILELQKSKPTLNMKNYLKQYLPERLASAVLKKAHILPNISMAHLKRELRIALLTQLHASPLNISGSMGYAKAEVTAGGVSLNEVSRKSLESNRLKGLYFCGEILDVDGHIGGFNFQWAWSSATVVAKALCA
ncbi:MAG: putative Rossmann fold flavoprotein [Candidatus Omnitrophota bacterium]|jgi:predicted Rossmann fold flavoprotein